MTDKALSAIIRQERAMQEVAILKRDIGQALAACPVSVELGRWDTSNTRRAELTDPNGRPKTHIWQALNFTDGGATAAGLLRRHAAEFEGVQRRLQINQYR